MTHQALTTSDVATVVALLAAFFAIWGLFLWDINRVVKRQQREDAEPADSEDIAALTRGVTERTT